MIYYTLDQAKRDLKIGYLTYYRINKGLFSENGEWVLLLGEGNSQGLLCSQREPNVARRFKTIAAVVSTLEEIGFRVNSLVAG